MSVTFACSVSADALHAYSGFRADCIEVVDFDHLDYNDDAKGVLKVERDSVFEHTCIPYFNKLILIITI